VGLDRREQLEIVPKRRAAVRGLRLWGAKSAAASQIRSDFFV